MAQTNKSKEFQKALVKTTKVETAKVVVDSDEAKRKYDMELVTGVFQFNEVPGGVLTFSFGKYKGTNAKYTLIDGETHTIPRCVANHLIMTGSYPIHEYETDINGVPIIKIGKKKKRYTFRSINSFDTQDSNESNIVTAERVLPFDL